MEKYNIILLEIKTDHGNRKNSKHGLILTACQMLRKLQSGKQQTKAGRIILTTKNKNSMAYNRHAIFIVQRKPPAVPVVPKSFSYA